MSNVSPGQNVAVAKAYSARCFSLNAGERPATDFAAFDRTGRAPRLRIVRPDESLPVLTQPAPDGGVYVEVAIDGAAFAALLLPGTYKPL